ncbi:hypothetical protein [Neisseria meningitidis]|nr:hypothetical protein [Neisseria meningitidis]
MKVTEIYKQKTATRRRHSRESGNPEAKSGGNVLEMTETQKTGFPPARE